jgi:DNA-binding transcriptional LysR family regulator
MVAPEIAGAIRVGITEYFVPTELPAILARFAAAHSGVRLDVRMGLTRDLREELARKTLDAVIVRLTPSERHKAIWSEPQVWVAPEDWKPMAGIPVPLVLLPEGCVLRHHALESMRRAKRPARIAFTGSSMVSVQAAVCAGIGVSIVPRSSLRPGMRVLANGRDYPDPGPLDFGVLRATGVDAGIVKALERVIVESMDVISVRPVRARLRAGDSLR